jgi:hypothetical protein
MVKHDATLALAIHQMAMLRHQGQDASLESGIFFL